MSQQLVVSNNNGQKLKENVKRDTRKLQKHLKKKQFKNEKNTKQEHTHVKNLKRQLMTEDFLCILFVTNWLLIGTVIDRRLLPR